MSLNNILTLQKIYLKFCLDFNSAYSVLTLCKCQMLFVIVLDLRFYGCCQPCLGNNTLNLWRNLYLCIWLFISGKLVCDESWSFSIKFNSIRFWIYIWLLNNSLTLVLTRRFVRKRNSGRSNYRQLSYPFKLICIKQGCSFKVFFF